MGLQVHTAERLLRSRLADSGAQGAEDILGVVGTSLLHPSARDPQARGKMERFWRTLREGCLDFLGSLSSLHEVNVRLWAFLDAHYHQAPQGAL